MNKKKNTLNIVRHSAAHLAAHALTQLFPKTKLTIGPATQEGFFYDFLPEENLKEADLALIEERMRELCKKDFPIIHKEIPKDQARQLYKDNPFKLELIDQIPGETVGLAIQGDFSDLCKGGHVASTGEIKHFKLLSLSGSYWRADKDNAKLQRIYGTAFLTQEDLEEYERQKEEALKYDHRRLGKELDLFSFSEDGVGFPFFHPHGKTILKLLVENARYYLKKDLYQEIETPTMLSDELWKRSGHYQHYKDKMYFSEKDDVTYAIRPMNCPGAILIYKHRPRSYKELPLRLAEFGHVHRYELSGVLHGLFRARAFTIDDGHIFCPQNAILLEVQTTIKTVIACLKEFSFESIHIYLSTRPEDSMGSDELWDKATQALHDSLTSLNQPYTVCEGEGAFYGPKIEFQIKDSMGRFWQCGTIQLDFFLPEQFDLEYINTQGTKDRPVMIHRAIYGSLERFFGMLLEHYKGKLPFWLAPIQMRVMTITDEQKEYATEITQILDSAGIRVQMDQSSDPISGKIKTAQLQQIPWMLVVGKKEVEQKTVTLRYRDGKQEFGLSLDSILEKAKQENKHLLKP